MLSRLTLLFALLLISIRGKGQVVDWCYSGDSTLHYSLSYSPQLRLDGGYLASLQNFTSADSVDGFVVVFNEAGVAQLSPTWPAAPWRISGYGSIVDPVHERYLFMAIPRNGNGFSQGFMHVVTDLDLNVISTTLHQHPSNSQPDSSDEVFDENGELIQVAGLSYPPTWSASSLLFQRFNSDNELVNTRIYENGLYLVRQMVTTEEGFTVLFFAAGGLGPYGVAKVLRFDTEFNYLGGFALPDIAGNGPVPGQDSIPMVKGIAVLPDGGFLVSGEYNRGLSQDILPILLKYAHDGTLLDTLIGTTRISPQGNLHGNSIVRGLRPLDNGNFVWAYEETQYEGVRSVNHFVTVDADLNIVRDVQLHGADDTSHVSLNGLVPTPDGGFFVTGVRFHGEFYNAWAAKLHGSPLSLEEHTASISNLYPNPGVSATAVLRSGQAQQAVFILSDTQGRNVQQAKFHGDRATVDGTHLASGIYIYRVVDHAGRISSTGKWVRE
ncbi:MAG: T9SS type A sorting domain-containing protein [Flavobacteriales bacterium]|nr:T9SS type A sorting domain-containing protein [Flavobacteriales bacterium]